MQTHQLKRIHENRKRMTVARGGKRGKTSGRGGKGQTARAGNKRRPEWRDIIKRLPKLRGRGKNSNKSLVLDSGKPVVVNLNVLERLFSAGGEVTPVTLLEKGAVSTYSGRIPSIKILGDGEVTRAVKISGCGVSASAKLKIEKAGGEIIPLIPIAVAKEEKVAKPTKTVKNEGSVAAEKPAKEDKKPVEAKEAKKAVKKEVKKEVAKKEVKK